MSNNYYMPRPVEPSKDWVGKLMSISLWVFAAGLAIYGLFALASDDIYVIPQVVQSWLVVIGSALITLGAEMNTPPTIVAVMRKIGRRQFHWLDCLIGALSLVGAMVGLWMVFAQRQEMNSATGWRAFVRDYGPILIGLTMIADYYGCGSELGLLRSDYDIEMQEWFRAEQEWNEAHGIEPEVDRSDWPSAKIEHFRALVASMNGDSALLTKDNLQEYLDPQRVAVRSASSTLNRWLQELN